MYIGCQLKFSCKIITMKKLLINICELENKLLVSIGDWVLPILMNVLFTVCMKAMSPEPAFLNIKEKGKPTKEAFCIRRSASAKELSISETAKYINSHWGSP